MAYYQDCGTRHEIVVLGFLEQVWNPIRKWLVTTQDLHGWQVHIESVIKITNIFSLPTAYVVPFGTLKASNVLVVTTVSEVILETFFHFGIEQRSWEVKEKNKNSGRG